MHKTVLQSSVKFETRRAQAVDEAFANAIHRVCEGCARLAACYLLDFRNPGTGEVGLLIALTVDDEARDMEWIAQRFMTVLKQFPTQGASALITSSGGFATRYAGHEFYVRPAQSSAAPKPVGTPPIDLNQPVENPELSAALVAFSSGSNADTQQQLIDQLRRAIFLVPMLTDEMRTTPGIQPGSVTIEQDSLIKIIACADREGANHLPLFTDWSAIQAWTDQKVSRLVMPAPDAWDFVLTQAHYAGAFINPGSDRLQLNREFVQHLKDGDKTANNKRMEQTGARR